MEFHNHMDQISASKIRMIGEKAAQMASEGRCIIKLQAGEPDFDTPQHIIDTAITALQSKDTHYAPNRGTMFLRQAIANKLWRDNRIKVDPAENIIVTTGCAEALMCACLGILDPGDEMIIIEPAFVTYVELAKLAGAVPVIIHAQEDNGWLPNIADVCGAITPRTKLLLINSPSNPTGAVYPRELLEALAELAMKHNFYVVSDEVYEKLAFGTEHSSIASLAGMAGRTITVNGLSKAYAMTGWRVGYLAAAKELITPLLKVHQYTTTCAPGFIQTASADALDHSEEDVLSMRQEYQRRRDLLCSLLRGNPKLSFSEPDGTFYLYVNIERTGLDSEIFVTRLLEEKGVATVFGTAFDHTLGGRNIRISFASSEGNLREGARRLLEFVDSL